jgi:hypothetical protein
MAVPTMISGITYYLINKRTNRMLSFAGQETAANEIFNLWSTKVPTPLIVIKDDNGYAKVLNFANCKTIEQIKSVLIKGIS